MQRRVFCAALCAATASACGGGTSIEGSAGGLTFDMSKATFVNSNFTAAADSTGATFLVLSTNSGMCGVLINRTVLQDVEALIVELAISNAGGSITFPSVAGTYKIVSSPGETEGDKSALVTAVGTGLCTSSGGVYGAHSGAVHLSHVEVDTNGIPQRLVGTVSAQFAEGEVDGNFDATLCDPRVETGAAFQIFLCGG